jgi:outer membrane protein assembly factor BamB
MFEMQSTKAIAAISAALVLGMMTATFLPGCQPPAAAPAPAPAPASSTVSGDSLTTDDAPAASVEAPAAIEAPAATPPAEAAPAPTADKPTADKPAEGGAAAAPGAVETPEQVAAARKVGEGNPVLEPGIWNQWGGNGLRNNTPVATGIPTLWHPGEFDRRTGKWDPTKAQNIKWVATLGSQTYGNTVVAAGKAFLGTNNSGGYLKRYPSDIDLGCLIAFREEDGKFLWQHSSEKLPTGRVHDWPLQGICCSPLVEGDRLWFVTSRGEVKCLDVQGFHDGEDDGPVTAEVARLFDVRRADEGTEDKVGPYLKELDGGKLPADLREKFAAAGMPLPDGDIAVTADDQAKAPAKRWNLEAEVNGAKRSMYVETRGPTAPLSAFKVVTPADLEEADVIWSFDMMGKLGISQHNMCSCSVTALGDILFVNTSNGVSDDHLVIPAPNAPSFMAMDKNTGEVFWTDNTPGKNVLHGQWSSPTVATIDGVTQVLFGGGDGWLYSFKADKGQDGKPELLWKFDANPKNSILELGGRGTRNDIISTPVVYDNKVYFCTGQDPEHGEGEGILWCLDPTKRGDISEELAVNRSDPKTPIPVKRSQAVVEADGDMAIPNPNVGVVWKYAVNDANGDGTIDFEEQFHRSISTVVIKNDLLFVPDFSGLFHCVDAQTGKVHWTHDMLAAAWGSAMIVEDKVYVGDEDGDISVFRLSADPKVAMQEIEGELYPINAVKDEDGRYEVVNMGNAVYCTPIVANGVLYIAHNDKVFAIAEGAKPMQAGAE